MAKTPVAKHTTIFGAFTCIELLACLAACALLVAIIAPALAATRARSDRAVCMSNLRQIGNALRQFALEHDGKPAWTQAAGGDGNYNQFGKQELWFQYWWLRDLLGTPKILMDPAERRPSAHVATEWGLVPGTGLQSLKNRAVAYPIGLPRYIDFEYEYTDVPRLIVALDRNFIVSGYCTYSGLSRESCAEVRADATGWHDDIHGLNGNVTFADGSVDTLTTQQLRDAVRKVGNPSGEIRVHSADWNF
jgi:prepilin-type processing-associated H-X9-DG protein